MQRLIAVLVLMAAVLLAAAVLLGSVKLSGPDATHAGIGARITIDFASFAFGFLAALIAVWLYRVPWGDLPRLVALWLHHWRGNVTLLAMAVLGVAVLLYY